MDQKATQNKNNTHTTDRGSKNESSVARWCNPWAKMTKLAGESSTDVSNRGLAEASLRVGTTYNINGKLVNFDKLTAEYEKGSKLKIDNRGKYTSVKCTTYTLPKAEQLVKSVWNRVARTLHPDSGAFVMALNMTIVDQVAIYRNWQDKQHIAHIISNQSDSCMLQLGLNPGSQTDIRQALFRIGQAAARKPHTHQYILAYVACGQGTVRVNKCKECQFQNMIDGHVGRQSIKQLSKDIKKLSKTMVEIQKLQNKIYPKTPSHKANKVKCDTRTGHKNTKVGHGKFKFPAPKWRKAKVAHFKRLLGTFSKEMRLLFKGEKSKAEEKRLKLIQQGKSMKLKKKERTMKAGWELVGMENLKSKLHELKTIVEEAEKTRLAEIARVEKERQAEAERLEREAALEKERVEKAKRLEKERAERAQLVGSVGKDFQIDAGNCWNSIPLLFFDKEVTRPSGETAMTYWAQTEDGKVHIGDGPMPVATLIKILDYYNSGAWEQEFGDLCNGEWDSDPSDEYAVQTNGRVWHLYRLGYNNYTDLVEYDEDGDEIRMEEDDGTQTTAGLNTFDLKGLQECLTAALKELSPKPGLKEQKPRIAAGGNCWDALPLVQIEGGDPLAYFRAQNADILNLGDEQIKDSNAERIWAMTARGEIEIDNEPMDIDTMLEILDYYYSGEYEKRFGPLFNTEFYDSLPQNEFAIDDRADVWHLYRIGYNNYSDLPKVDFGGYHTQGLVGDDGSRSAEGLERHTLEELGGVLRAKRDKLIESRKKAEPTNETTESDTTIHPTTEWVETHVGGPGDCWKALWRLPYTKGLENDHQTQTLAGFVGKLIQHQHFFQDELIYLDMRECEDGDWHLQAAKVVLPSELETTDLRGFIFGRDWVRMMDPNLDRFFSDFDAAMSLFGDIGLLKSPIFQHKAKEEPILIGAVGVLPKLTSISHALGAAVMPDTSKWEQLVDNHDLRAAALAIAKVDHQGYGLPGVRPEHAMDELTNPEKGGWALGMNMTFTNKGSPQEAELAVPEAAATHMSRQLSHGTKVTVYNCPEWLNPTDYLEVDRHGKTALIFGTRDEITTANLASMLTKKTGATIVIPSYNKEMPSFITSETGDDVFQRDTDHLHVVNSCMTKVVSHDINLLHGLNVQDLISISNALWKITTMGVAGMYKVIHLSKLTVSSELFSHMVSINYNTVVRKWSVFMPTTDTILGTYIPTFQMREVTIDAELFRTMCAHNLHRGDLSFQAMMSRAIGYAHRRYHSKHGAVQRIDISHERLVDHAFIATICVRRAYIQRRWLMNMDNEPAWVKAAIKYGITAGQMALQALHEGSGTFRELEMWTKHIQKVSVMNLHDFTDQSVFNEIEAWSMESDTKGWSCHVAGQVYKVESCGHHQEDCNHTGPKLCKCCAGPSIEEKCECCLKAACQSKHACSHKCDGEHTGYNVCECCGMSSDENVCRWCSNPYNEYDEELEWQDFEEKIMRAGGTVPNTQQVRGPGYTPAGPAPTEKLKPGQEYKTKNGTSAIVPIEDAIDMGDGKHLHKCAMCLQYYIHTHNMTSVKHPLFKGDCPWCEGSTKSIKTDDKGNAVSAQDAEKSAPKTDLDDPNRRTLIENGYAISEIESIAGNPQAYMTLLAPPTETTITLPLIPTGNSMIQSNNTNFTEFGSVEDNADCGIETMRTWLSKAKKSDFIAVLNKTENFTTEDMVSMAEYYRTNMVIMSPEETVISKNQERDTFHVILADTPGHWRPGMATMEPKVLCDLTRTGASVRTVQQLKSRISKRVVNPETANLLTEIELIQDVVDTNNITTVVIDDNCICNNKFKKHDPKQNNFYFELDQQFPSLARRLIENPTMATYNEACSMAWEHQVKTDVIQEIKYRIINAAIGIAETHLLDKLPQGSYDEYRLTIWTRTSGSYTYVTLPKGKWRKNDVVYMTSADHSGWHAIMPVTTIDAMNTQTIVTPMKLPQGGSFYKMKVSKASYSSTLKTLNSLNSLLAKCKTPPQTPLQHKTIIGAPGSGKSTQIVDNIKNTDMVVTFTNGNMVNMRTKLAQKHKESNPPGTKLIEGKNSPYIRDILSAMEEAAKTKPIQVDRLFIDECTMASLVEYAALKTFVKDPDNPENILLYGDNSQIGHVTITKMRQLGSMTELQNFVAPEKIQYWDFSWRMGSKMCDVASYVTGRKIVSELKNENTITTYNLTDPAEQIRAIQRVKPKAVIICFTSSTLRYLDARNIKGATFKVHGYQGQEADDIIVIQEKATAKNTIPADPRYCYSAFTRAKKSIHWISMGPQTGPIENRIGKIGTLQGFVGNSFTSKLKNFLHLKKRGIEIQETDQDVLNFMQRFQTANTKTQMSQEARQTISAYAKSKYGVNLMYHDNADGSVTMQFFKGSMLGVEAKYDNEKITISKDKFNAMNEANVAALEAAIKNIKQQDIVDPIWVDCTQLGSTEVKTLGLIIACVSACQPMGLGVRLMGKNREWYVTGHDQDWRQIRISDGENETIIKSTGEDDIMVTDKDATTIHEFLNEVWEHKKGNMGLNISARASSMVLDAMAAVRLAKDKIKQIAAVLIGMEFNEAAENHKQYEEQFNKFNARNLLAYKLLEPHTLPDQPILVGAQNREGELGWIMGGKFYHLKQKDEVEAAVMINSVSTMKDSWVYRLAELISSAKNFVTAKAMGANLKPWADHAAEDTHTSQYVSNKISQLKARLLKYEQKPITLTPSANKEWTTLIELTMSSCGYNWTSHPNLLSSNDAAAEQVALRMLNDVDDLKLYGLNSDATLLSGLYKAMVLQPLSDANRALFKMTMPSLLSACDRIIASNVEKLAEGAVKDNLASLVEAATNQKAGIDVWTGKFNPSAKHRNLVVNNQAIDYSTRDKYNAELFGIVDANNIIKLIINRANTHDTPHSNAYEVTSGQYRTINSTYNTVSHYSEEVKQLLECGKTVWHGKNYSADIVAGNNALEIWQITDLERTSLFSPVNTPGVNGLQKIELPNITTNIFDMISKGEVMRKRIVYVDKRLYRSLALRAMRDATTYEDLLVAARTQLHGVIYSPGSVVWKHITDSSILMDTALVAHWKGKRLLKNAGEAVRLMADSLSENIGTSTLGRLKEITYGMSGHLTKLLGLNLNWNQVAAILEASDVEMLNKIGVEMEKWAVRVDEYSREIHGVTKKIRSDTKVTSAITGFAVSNLLHVRSLVMPVRSTALREYNPKKRRLIKKTEAKINVLRQTIETHAKWWLQSDALEPRLNALLANLAAGGRGTGRLANMPAMQGALIEAIRRHDDESVGRILDGSEGQADHDSDGQTNILRRLQTYRGIANESNISTADSITAERLEGLLAMPEFKLTKKNCNTLSQLAKDADEMEARDYTKLWNAFETITTEHGTEFKRTHTKSKNISQMRVCIVATGSRGDIRPSHNLAKQMAMDGAEVSLLCPRNSLKESETYKINYVYGNYDVEEELKKWHKLMEWTPESIDIIMRDDLDNNWLRQLEINKLETGYDLIVGSPVTPMGLALAYIYNTAYIDFCPMPLRNVAGNLIEKVYARLLSREYVLLHEKAINSLTEELLGTKADIPALLMMNRPYALAADSKLIQPQIGQIMSRAVGYWGGKTNDERYDKLDFVTSNLRTVITMGSMVDQKASERLLTNMDNKTTVVLAKSGTPLCDQALRHRIPVYSGDYNLSTLPSHLTVVHHGGAGTTAEVTRSKCWQVIVPIAFDQEVWARAVEERGLGRWIKGDRNVTTDDVTWRTPNTVDVKTNVVQFASEFTKLLSENTGAAWIWPVSGSIFTTGDTGSLYSWHRLIGTPKPNVADPDDQGVYYDIKPRALKVTYDPIGTVEGEDGTCGVRAIDHVLNESDEKIKTRLNKMGTTMDEINHLGMTVEQLINYCLDAQLNPVLCTERSCKAVIAHASWTCVYLWWQTQGHVVLIEPVELPTERLTIGQTNNSYEPKNLVQCTLTDKSVYSWPNKPSDEYHADLCINQDQLEEEIKRVVRNAPSTKNPGEKAYEWSEYAKRIIKERIKSNFASARRKTHCWIRTSNIKMWGKGVAAMENTPEGKLVAFHNDGDDFILGISVGRDEDGWTYYITSKTIVDGINPSGLMLDANTYLTSGEDKANVVVPIRAVNSLTNILLGKAYPICANFDSKEADKVLLGYHDGVPHHWNKNLFTTYGPDQVLFTEDEVANGALYDVLKNNKGPCKLAVHKSDVYRNLVLQQSGYQDLYMKQCSRRWNVTDDTFGVCWRDAEMPEEVKFEIERLTTPIYTEEGFYKLKLPFNIHNPYPAHKYDEMMTKWAADIADDTFEPEGTWHLRPASQYDGNIQIGTWYFEVVVDDKAGDEQDNESQQAAIDTNAPFWYTIDESDLEDGQPLPAPGESTRFVITNSTKGSIGNRTSLSHGELWLKVRDDIVQNEYYLFIKCSSVEEAVAWMQANFAPADAEHNVSCGPPRHDNSTRWTSHNGLVKYKDGIATDWRLQMTKEQWTEMMKAEPPVGYANIRDVYKVLGMTKEQLESVIEYTACEVFQFRNRVSRYEHLDQFYAEDDWFEGLTTYATSAQLLLASNGQMESDTLDPNYPVGEIKYRKEEVNEFRNGNGKQMHNLTDKIKLDRSDQIDTKGQKWEKVASLILDRFLKPHHTHIVVTATSEWNPEEQKQLEASEHKDNTLYINLTYDDSYQQGWKNVVIPKSNTNNIKSLRQARTMFFYVAKYNPAIMVTVVGGREDFTNHSKGIDANYPKTKGVLKHMPGNLGCQLYMNNCSGQLGTLDHAKTYWKQDMELTSHIYGTDEWLAYECAANYTVLARLPVNTVHCPQPWAAYIQQPTLAHHPAWVDKDQNKKVEEILKNYGLEATDDNKAIAVKLLRWGKTGTSENMLTIQQANCDPSDIACALEPVVTSADSKNYYCTTMGLERTENNRDLTLTAVPDTDTYPLFIMPGCVTNNIEGYKTVTVGMGRMSERELRSNTEDPDTLLGLIHSLAATSYKKAIVQIKSYWPDPSSAASNESITEYPTIRPIYMGTVLTAIMYTNPQPQPFRLFKTNRDARFSTFNEFAEKNYTMGHRYLAKLESAWPRGPWLPMASGQHWKESELNHLLGHASMTKAKPVVKVDGRPGPNERGHITTTEVINELTAVLTAMPVGPLRDKMVEEMTIWDNVPPDKVFGAFSVNKTASEAVLLQVAITKQLKSGENILMYHKPRGQFLVARAAKNMTYEQDDEDDVEAGLWFNTQEVETEGIEEADKHGVKQGYVKSKEAKFGVSTDKKVDEAQLMPWAIAVPEEEAREALAHMDKRSDQFVIHRDLITAEEQGRLNKENDIARLNGQLKAISRRTEPGKILLTWGPKTVDQKILLFRGAMMLSVNRFTEENAHTRDALREGPEADRLTIVNRPEDMVERLLEARKEMFEKCITEKTVLLQDLPLTEFLTNQLHDYELGSNVGTGNPNAKHAYMPLTNAGFSGIGESATDDGQREPVTDEIIAMYENNDLSDLVRIQAPLNRGEGKGFVGTAMPIQVITSRKTALTEYPIASRPVLTQMAYSTENAVFNVLGSQVTYRKTRLDPKHEVNQFIKTYGGPDTQTLLNKWKKEPLTFDIERIQEWLAGRTGVQEIDRELQQILAEGLFNQPINKLNVHNKLESLLKSAPITNFAQQQVRTIVWQQKGYAALFSHVFLQAKARLKEVLGPKFLYADGLTPEALSNRCRIERCLGFLEDDLTKQDRQTDEDTINCEMRIYTEVLGVHQDVVQLWRSAHDHWFFKGSGIKGRLNMMRHTGQATTAIGNVLVNLLVHRRMADRLGESLKLMMVLGDDNLTLTDKAINPRSLRVEIRDLWNMESKAEFSERSGVFLRMLACKDSNGRVQLGPDYVRLRNRFEFTNGQHMISDETIEARSLSYACMLGPLPGVMRAIDTCSHKVEPVAWYDPIPQVEAVGDYYFKDAPSELRAGMVHNEINLLCKMMSERRTFEYSFDHYTTVEKR
nr:polyprotein [Alphaendornavirus sp.]